MRRVRHAPDAILGNLYLDRDTKFSEVSNTRAQVLQNWQDSLTYVVWFQNGRAVNLRNPPAWREMTRWSFFPIFGGSAHPKV